MQRKLSMVVQLSKPEDYEGGELEFYFPRTNKTLIIKPFKAGLPPDTTIGTLKAGPPSDTTIGPLKAG